MCTKVTKYEKSRLGKFRLGVGAFALAAVSSFAADSAAIAGQLKDISDTLDALVKVINGVIGPAMLAIAAAVTILVIVVKLAKKPRSAG